MRLFVLKVWKESAKMEKKCAAFWGNELRFEVIWAKKERKLEIYVQRIGSFTENLGLFSSF